MKYSIFFIFIFCFPVILVAQWFPLPVPTVQSLAAITYTDTLHGYMPLGDGTILETYDAGINWQVVPTGISFMLADIWFPTSSTGYAAGNNGAVVKTTNGGNSWSAINSPTGQVLRGVFFLNPDTGFVCGQQEHIYRTTNGGTTWVSQTSGSYWLRQFSFPTPQIGYCAGDGARVYKTTNGGVSWSLVSGGSGTNINDVDFVSVDTGFVCGINGYAAKSFDGGLTWQVLTTGISTSLEGLWFFNNQTGYCVGVSSKIMKTTDGGASWITQTCPVTADLRRLYFFNQNKGFITGSNGTLLELGYCMPSPGFITGPSSVCQGDAGKTYSVNPVSGATGYNWTVPPGVVITSGNNTNSITVTFTAGSASGAFSVYGYNSGCNGTPSPNFQVTVNPSPVPVINGPVQVCANSGNTNYTTQPGMTNYLWIISPGGTIVSGMWTSSIQVHWLTPGNQSLSVGYTSGTGCSSITPGFLTIVVDPLPATAGAVTGSQSVCAGIQNVQYSTASIPDANSYNWLLPPGFHLISGNGTDQITIGFDYTAVSGNIGVYGINSCGNGDTSFLHIDVHSIPVLVISGNDSVCQNVQYTFNTQSGMSGYQWSVSPGGSVLSGGTATNDFIVIDWTSTGSHWVKVNYTDTFGCTDTLPVTKNIWVRQEATAAIAISASEDTVCAGTPVTFNATATNTGTSPVYLWKVNGLNQGTNSPIYIYDPINGDQVSCILTSNEYCVLGSPATSNIITLVVHPLLPVSVSVSPSLNPVCEGTLVTFTANPTNPGNTPVYQWKVNGIDVGTNSLTYSYIPLSGDQVSCRLSSDAICATGNPATSNTISMTVDQNMPVSVSVAASLNPVCSGNPVTFTATPVNGGSTPVYQWKINGVNTGLNNSSYQFVPVNGDIVYCILTSNLICTTGNPGISNTIMMNVLVSPVVSYSLCNDPVTTTNAKPFKLRGGLPLGGSYTGPGVNTPTGIFTPSIAGIGIKTITYTFINAALCSASATSAISVVASPVFICGSNITDVRDNKVYPTVTIGSQCWMAANLNYGSLIPGTASQRDNCIVEKYCYSDIAANCGSQTYYQWDEVMQYDETVSDQGLCPPAWHVPAEADWNILFRNFINSGFAGSPLKYSGFSGFDAMLTGTRHMTENWDLQEFASLFWSSTVHGPNRSWAHGMNDPDPSVSLYPAFRNNAFSVRCIHD